MVEDSAKDFGHLFPGLTPVPMKQLSESYEKTIEKNISGQILKVY